MRRVVVLLITLMILTGCGTEAEKKEKAEISTARPTLQFRKVAVAVPGTDGTVPTAPAEWVARFANFTCPTGEVEDVPGDEYAMLCDGFGTRYLLEPALVGTVADATAAVPDKQVDWVVNIDLDEQGTAAFADLSRELADTGRQLAMVLDGRVLSAPQVNAVITNGKMQISGDFTEKTATELADRLAGR